MNPPEGTTPKRYTPDENGEMLEYAGGGYMDADDHDRIISALEAKLAEANATVKERNDYLTDTLNQIDSLRTQLEETQARLSRLEQAINNVLRRYSPPGSPPPGDLAIALEYVTGCMWADNEALRNRVTILEDQLDDYR